MNKITGERKKFTSYDYKEVEIEEAEVSMYIDGYMNFGWIADGDRQPPIKGQGVKLRLKRDRVILNKVELTRLERHFESCMNELKSLKKLQTSVPTMVSLCIGIAGTAFMACSTFAVTASPPLIGLCVLFAVPGFIGWILPYFIYKSLVNKQKEKLAPLLEDKYDEIYEICKKGNSLLL